jgi:hypothetical protein
LSGIQTWDATWAMITEGRLPIIDPKIEDTTWRHDENRQLWIGPHDRSA